MKTAISAFVTMVVLLSAGFAGMLYYKQHDTTVKLPAGATGWAYTQSGTRYAQYPAVLVVSQQSGRVDIQEFSTMAACAEAQVYATLNSGAKAHCVRK